MELYSVEREKKDKNIIDTTIKAMSEFIPADVTAFYLGFYGLEAVKADTQLATVWLPVGGLIATLILRYFSPKAERIWLMAVSALSFVSWVYATGGQFFTLQVSPIRVTVAFALANLIVPVVYRKAVLKK